MIDSVIIKSNSLQKTLNLEFENTNKIIFNNLNDLLPSLDTFFIQINFNSQITSFRNHDYTWVDINSDRIANDFSPKILKLENDFYVQSTTNQGIWEIKKKYPNKLFWHFNPKNSKPLTNYSSTTNQKVISNANNSLDILKEIGLLFSQNGAIEISRSKIPFTAIACFTDHCDFDTAENLEKQRVFFKKNNIITTKGIFLNHFSKRVDNASWENNKIELQKWSNDGHELCYHSLSQSIKSKTESLHDFTNFEPPILIKTWIDHGYQPYNLSLYKKEEIDELQFATNLKNKQIEILWNYIDSATITNGVLNQLNTNHFTLFSFYKGIKNESLKKRISLFVKNAIVHFYCNEKLTKKYSQLASSFKKVAKIKSISSLFLFINTCFTILIPLLKIVLFWNSYKNKVYTLAKFQTTFFYNTIANQRFIIFQTLEFLDFKNALNKKSVDTFIAEKGLFIAHTYFSVPMEYHQGRIFSKSGEINPLVSENFEYLGQNIVNNKIWNPTLQELAYNWEMFNLVEFDNNNLGEIIIKNCNIPFRSIT